MGLRCFIVDDSTDFLEAARSRLESDGLTVVGVASTIEQRPANRLLSHLGSFKGSARWILSPDVRAALPLSV